MKKKHYSIMDKPYLELLLEEVEDKTVSFAIAAISTFYKAKGEIVSHAINNYQNVRFTKRIERFAEQEKLFSHKQIKDFYLSIDENKLDILFELFEKARTSTYDLHAKILAKLYGNFLKNGELDYHEKTFLSNIDILNEDDLYKFYNALEDFFKKENIDIDTAEMKRIRLVFKIDTYTEHYIYEKLIRVGLFVDARNIDGGLVFQKNSKFQNKGFFIYLFTKEMYKFIKEIMEYKSGY